MLCVVAPPGDHEYVPPPVDGVAVSVTLCPAQILCELTVTGFDAILIVCEVVATHPSASVT